jgi:hypothetical protein
MEGRDPRNGKEESTRPQSDGGGLEKRKMKKPPPTW